MYNVLSETKKKYKIISIKLCLVLFRYVLKSRYQKSLFLSSCICHSISVFISFAALDHLIHLRASSQTKTQSISPRYKKRLEFYLLTKSVNRQNERDNICCKKFFSKNETLLPLYAVKKSLNISTIFINYQQRVIAVYINYMVRDQARVVRSCFVAVLLPRK